MCAWLKAFVSFPPPKIVIVSWPSSWIEIARSNMCSGRTLSFVRPTACLCRKSRGACASAAPAVWRWQARYAEQGVDGLLRDKTRKPGRAPLSAKVVAKVMDLTCSEPPGHATHWTGRAMAKVVGVSLRAVQRLWDALRLQPHRIRTFKRSTDPELAKTVEDIDGLYDLPKPRRSYRSTRRARSRRSTALNRACRLSRENAER